MMLLNLGYRWSHVTTTPGLDGIVYLACGNHIERVSRAPRFEVSHTLFDPQIYLSGLDAEVAEKTCGRLATYPWFGIADIPSFDSDIVGTREWEAEVRDVVAANWEGLAPEGEDVPVSVGSALAFQAEIGCTHLIAPTPLVVDRDDQFDIQSHWLDEAIAHYRRRAYGQPLLATIALSDVIITERIFEALEYLELVCSQIAARDDFAGAYVLVAQSGAAHPLRMPTGVARCYKHMVEQLSGAGLGTVITNFADTWGVPLIGCGAAAFGTGPSQGLRRLSLSAFRDEGGGMPLPTYYSHKARGEFRPQTDLERIAEAELLECVDDTTVFSEALFRSLREGGSAAAAVSWAESRNNVTASQKHFLARMVLEGKKASRAQHRGVQWVRAGLEKSIEIQEELDEILEDNENKAIVAPATEWLEIFEEE